VLTIVFCRLLLAAAAPYMPPKLIAAMTPSTAIATIRGVPDALLVDVDSARDGFQRAGGNTAIIDPNRRVATTAPMPVAPRRAAVSAARQPATAPPIAPKSRASRLLAGTAATVLPRTIGEPLGLFHIAGGRSMLWFTELDTLIFDISLLLAILSLVMRFRT